MEAKFVIQDVITKDYFWDYRCDYGFTTNLKEANTFSSEKQAEEIIEDILQDYEYEGRVFQLRKFYGL